MVNLSAFRSVAGQAAIAARRVVPLALVVLAAGCAGSTLGDSLQQSLEADPQLQDRPVLDGDTPETSPEEAIAPEEPPPAAVVEPTPTPTPQVTSAADRLAEVPEDLRGYVEDWLALGLLDGAGPGNAAAGNGASGNATAGNAAGSPEFVPNQPITRGEFAQWLLSANNAFYPDAPAKRIRAATGSATPAFQDVPATHPYFAAIQGLAEAGIIPSAKTGNATAVTFRPDAPLTRETLVLWKVPLDTRAALPTATAEAVTTTWGFQDTAKIEPLALRAVLADHQNGDFANIRRAFGFTTLFQPQKGVSQAEAAAALWRFGTQTDGVSAKDVLSPAAGDEPSSP